MNLEVRQQQGCYTLHASYQCNDSRREFGIFARSVRVKLLLNCYTAAGVQRHITRTYAALPSLVPSTNRPFGYLRRYTKRLTIATTKTMEEDIRHHIISLGGPRPQRPPWQRPPCQPASRRRFNLILSLHGR